MLPGLKAQPAPDVNQVMKSANEKVRQLDYASSIKDFNKALRMSPGLVEAYYGRAVAKYNIGQYDEALRDVNKAIDAKQNYAEAFLVRGQILVATKKFDDALADFDHALVRKNDLYEAVSQKALTTFQLGKEKEAFEIVNKAIEANDKAAELFFCRGTLYNNKQKFEKALNDFNKCLETDPGYNTYYVLLARGTAHLSMQEFKEADDDFSKAIALLPNIATAYSSRSRLKYEQGNYKESVADLSKAIEINPENASVYYNLGMAYYKLNDVKNACERFHKACSMGNTNACKMVVLSCVENK
jgi:tetratricopeptide (TPR) repeat protein